MCMYTNVKKYFWITMLLLLPTAMTAETTYDRLDRKHELRLGWGDQLFETLMWHRPTNIATTLPETYRAVYHENYLYSQHVWLEYQYRVNDWFSVGGMVDGSGVQWDDVTRNGKGREVSRDPKHNFYNIVMMPTIRFTYFHHEYVNLYSGLGLGMDINGGTEKNAMGNTTEVGAALQITVFGVSANYKQWFWTVDFGGLTALRHANYIYMAASRIMNVGLGVRF